MKQCCQNCGYWKAIDDRPNPVSDRGECRAALPQCDFADRVEGWVFGYWPTTPHDSWCGHWNGSAGPEDVV